MCLGFCDFQSRLVYKLTSYRPKNVYLRYIIYDHLLLIINYLQNILIVISED